MTDISNILRADTHLDDAPSSTETVSPDLKMMREVLHLCQVTLQNSEKNPDLPEANLKPAFDALGDRLGAMETRFADLSEALLGGDTSASARQAAELASTLKRLDARLDAMDERITSLDRFNSDMECSLVASVKHIDGQIERLNGQISTEEKPSSHEQVEAALGRQAEFLIQQLEAVGDAISARTKDQGDALNDRLETVRAQVDKLATNADSRDPAIAELHQRFCTMETELATVLSDVLDQRESDEARDAAANAASNKDTEILRELSLHMSKLAEEQHAVRGETASMDARMARMERRMVEVADGIKADLAANRTTDPARETAQAMAQTAEKLDEKIVAFSAQVEDLYERQAQEQELRIARAGGDGGASEKEVLNRTNVGLQLLIERLNGDCERFAASIEQIAGLDMAQIMESAADRAAHIMAEKRAQVPEVEDVEGSELSRFEQAMTVLGEMVGRIEPTVRETVTESLSATGLAGRDGQQVKSLTDTLLHSVSNINMISTDVSELAAEARAKLKDADPATLHKLYELTEATRRHTDTPTQWWTLLPPFSRPSNRSPAR